MGPEAPLVNNQLLVRPQGPLAPWPYCYSLWAKGPEGLPLPFGFTVIAMGLWPIANLLSLGQRPRGNHCPKDLR